MKRGKDGENMVPMFPRLHVNDTAKGGPRAPPRNKMALYEQFSIPSQRFSNSVRPINQPHSSAANLVHLSNQGVGNEIGMLFRPCQLPTGQSEKRHNQHRESNSPLTRVKQRKKLDEDDFTVPVFVNSISSQECNTYYNNSSDLHNEKLSSKSSYISNPLSTKETECQNKEIDLPVDHEPGDNSTISIHRLTSFVDKDAILCSKTQAADERHDVLNLGENIVALDKRNSSTAVSGIPSDDRNISPDLIYEAKSCEDVSWRSMQMKNPEKGDSVNETSGVDYIFTMDITPDDVVEVIGQKRFWKARRTIANQQRVFAIQVFELHRLIKVQKLMAGSPHLLHDDSVYLGKTTHSLPDKEKYHVEGIPYVSQQKDRSELIDHGKERSAENTVGKASFPSIPNGVSPSSCMPLSNNAPSLSMNTEHNTAPWCFNQPNKQQWLIPVMSPSEGLIYKPYSGPGFGGCGPPGLSNPMIGNFVNPPYGVPAPYRLYHLPSFPLVHPYGYFPPYGMPTMNPHAFPDSSVDQQNAPSVSCHASMTEANVSVHVKEAMKMMNASEGMEAQASIASSVINRNQGNKSGSSMREARNAVPHTNDEPQELEQPIQVIKVVPHNARSATESAARIFLCIQEERKRYGSV